MSSTSPSQWSTLPVSTSSKDSTCLPILLSYAASDCLGILKFKIINEAATITLDALITLNKQQPKQVTFKANQINIIRPSQSASKHSMQQTSPKLAMKITPSQVLTKKTIPSKDHAKKIAPSQDHTTSTPTIAADCNIVALRKAFPTSFDTIGYMSGMSIICTEHIVSPSCQIQGINWI